MGPIQIKGDKDTAGMVPKGEHLLTLEILVECTLYNNSRNGATPSFFTIAIAGITVNTSMTNY